MAYIIKVSILENNIFKINLCLKKVVKFCSEKELTVEIDLDYRVGLMRAHSSIHILNSILNSYLVVTCQSSSCVKKDYMSLSFELFGQKFSPEGKYLIK